MDTLSPDERSKRMARIRSKDTTPEMRVRKLVHSMGYRYRLHVSKIPGHPDLVFAKRRKIIFVHGCFWHRHQDPSCKLSRLPKSREDFWVPKLEGNRARDLRVQEELGKQGWDILVVWECQLQDITLLSETLRRFLEG